MNHLGCGYGSLSLNLVMRVIEIGVMVMVVVLTVVMLMVVVVTVVVVMCVYMFLDSMFQWLYVNPLHHTAVDFAVCQWSVLLWIKTRSASVINGNDYSIY